VDGGDVVGVALRIGTSAGFHLGDVALDGEPHFLSLATRLFFRDLGKEGRESVDLCGVRGLGP
jgi:hypothetical protein